MIEFLSISLAIIGITTALFYAVLMLAYLRSWQKQQLWAIPTTYVPKTSVDVLVPARNEAPNIEACLNSIFQNNYPPELFQVWVIDDFSEDDTAEIYL